MIIVTGGAGFIGSNLVAALAERNCYEIVVCDRFGHDDKWRNISKHEIAHLIDPDQLFPFLEKHAKKVKAIFHMGAISSTVETDVDLIVESNFRFSSAILEWCMAHKVSLIYASSAATYGDGEDGFEDKESPEELATLQPLNAYGWSKHLFDRRVARLKEQGALRDTQCAGLKFFNVYGPNEYHKGGQRSVAEQLYYQITQTGAAKLFKSYDPNYTDGGQVRDFVWVGDCVNVMLWLLDHPKVSGLFNVGSGKGRSFQDLAHAVAKALNISMRIEYVPMPETLRDKYQYFTEAKMKKLQAHGYDRPLTTLEEGVAQYVKYLSSPDRYR